ncbi:MAG: glycine dehydrogenase (aminomethyl-transferring), partial [Flavobacteriaceae bacterium]|nr:glycine dehydrogenase (aminomethyl-transferring) [Flavobacteriaceae bacterium]
MKTFADRHIGISASDLSIMLKQINAGSLEQLIAETIPADIRLGKPMDLPSPMSESEVLDHLQALADSNEVYRQFIGLGYHETILPSVIKRNILENPGWYTAYTPYQAEIAQGRLEALLNYQTVITDLTGMELANASLLDESTAAAEAMTMLYDLRSRAQKKDEVLDFFVDEQILPQTLSLLQTRSTPLGIKLVVGDLSSAKLDANFFGALVQYPGKYGAIPDLKRFKQRCEPHDIRIAVAADIMSLVVLEAPGHYGVDVVVGTTQRFGIPLGYGGPHAAFFATKSEYKRSIPGRIIGKTVDTDGNPALRMALQTREQHIKRDKATSNICTAQVLLAVMASMYAVYHGPDGLRAIAGHIRQMTGALAYLLKQKGIRVSNTTFFDTLHVSGIDAQGVKTHALAASINLNYIDASSLSLSLGETVNALDVARLVEIISEVACSITEVETTLSTLALSTENEEHARNTLFLTHEVFHSYQSETELMRYIKRLERKDLALNHSMIALGSCTMKLNAATEMLPLSWAKWANLHPFVPQDQAKGYQTVLSELERYLN